MTLTLPGYSQEWDDPVSVTCVPGAATTSKCKILVVTIKDPSVNPVTVIAAGQILVSGVDFTMQPVNTDGPATIAWSGVAIPSGLNKFTRYEWIVSQDGFSDNGSFMTAPDKGDNFRVVFASCDAVGHANISGRVESHHGIWPEYKRLAEEADPPVPILLFIDDYGYCDGQWPDDSTGNTGLYALGAGSRCGDIANNVRGSNPEYNYTLGWLNLLGFMGGDEVALENRLWGRAKERAWCRKNINLYFQWGDHEFDNDVGWDSGKELNQNPDATWMHKTYDGLGNGNFDGPAYSVFERLFGLIRPDTSDYIPGWVSTDTDAKHWCAVLGDVCIVAPDFITNCIGNYTGAGIPNGATATQVYGNAQIDDVLNMMDTAKSPFNFLGMAAGFRYPQTNFGVSDYPVVSCSEFGSGTQHPLYDHMRTEFDRLVSAIGNTPPSIMDNPRCNGAYGTTISLHGDYHRAHVYKLSRPASTGILEEVLYSICVGTVNGSINFTPITEAPAGIDNNWVGAECVGPDIGSSTRTHWGLTVEILGTESPKQAVVTLLNENYQAIWSGKFCQYRGNYAYSLDTDLSMGSAVSSAR